MKKIFYILGIIAVTLTSCVTKSEYPWGRPDTEDATPWLVISPSKLRVDGDVDANFRVFALGEEVTSETQLYIIDENGEASDFTATSFEPTRVGDFTFYATYGDLTSKQVTLRVVEELDELPEDTDAANTSFYNRVMMTDFTGTTCQYCPIIAAALHVFEETETAHKATISACHSYATADPMYNSYVAALGTQKEVMAYPAVMYGLDKSNWHTNKASIDATVTEFQARVDALWVENAKVGITSSAYLSGAKIHLMLGVKAAEAGTYSVNAFLLESGIRATQNGVTVDLEGFDVNVHNHVIRTGIAESVATNNFTGVSLGQIPAGQQKTVNTTIAIEDVWRLDNADILIYVSDEAGNVVNSIVAPANGDLSYDYNK